MAAVEAADDAPTAAMLTAARARGFGITAALWAGSERTVTQAWAEALHRAGWRALYHGLQHDPTGRLRAVTLFDRAGEHPPYDDLEAWPYTTHSLNEDQQLLTELHAYGITVQRDRVEPVFTSLDDAGLTP